MEFPELRIRLAKYDDVELSALCLDYFPEVYSKFTQGMRRDEKDNLLLDHCRRNSEALARLIELLKGKTGSALVEIIPQPSGPAQPGESRVKPEQSPSAWQDHEVFKIPLKKDLGNLALLIQRRGEIAGPFWKLPYGEPEWVEIPAGKFWMGGDKYDDEKPVHQVYLDRYLIAKTPITNAQYQIFVNATRHQPPKHWENEQLPTGKENHPVVNVSWHDAIAYCEWLSKMTGKAIRLPSEAEWEKAARGDKDKRDYPWGTWKDGYANTKELQVMDTTPVGVFPEGASPYGVLDMCGNVSEWTRSSKKEYPYNTNDGRENADQENIYRILRGGSYFSAINRSKEWYFLSETEDINGDPFSRTLVTILSVMAWMIYTNKLRCYSRSSDKTEVYSNENGFRVSVSLS